MLIKNKQILRFLLQIIKFLKKKKKKKKKKLKKKKKKIKKKKKKKKKIWNVMESCISPGIISPRGVLI